MASRKRKHSTTKPRKAAAGRQPKQRLGEFTISPELSTLSNLVQIEDVSIPSVRGVECLAKNPIFELAEAKFNSLRIEQKEQFLRELLRVRDLPQDQRVDAYMQLNERYQLLRGGTAIAHVKTDWLRKYFSPFAINTLIAGAIVAVQRAVDTGLPIDMYWAAGPDAGMRFAVAESPYQITFLLTTPKIVGRDTKITQLDRPERIWFTHTGSEGKVTVMQQYSTALKR
jgi:hypothetical protein